MRAIVSVVVLGLFLAVPPVRAETSAASPRVAARVALEEIRDRHRIWPGENARPKPAFERERVAAELAARLDDEAREESALSTRWGIRMGAPDLQAELDRMARDTRDAALLAEEWAALGNDPVRIADAQARPLLVGRRIRERFEADPPADRVAGEGFDAWWKRARAHFAPAPPQEPAGLTLPAIADSPCSPDSWSTMTAAAPIARAEHTALWTGTEMLVWGGVEGDFFNSGSRYDPATDTWSPMSSAGAPTGRHGHTAIWTGTEMIVYGGRDPLGSNEDGGRYNPATDTWRGMATFPAVNGQRTEHTAVWTGSRMLVWGGINRALFSPFTYGNGGRYDPVTDTWSGINTAGAPTPRYGHSAVWTGTEMVIWGGARDVNLSTSWVNTGSRYDPATNTWSAIRTTGAPSARAGHTGVWTGDRLLIWGGSDNGTTGSFAFASGGSYDPRHDRWTAVSTTNAPSPRVRHTAVWTGARMVVWGGDLESGAASSGGRYDPASDTWSATASAGAPAPRGSHTAVWTGSRMIVFGGRVLNGETRSSGGRYDPVADTWSPTRGSDVFRPLARSGHVSVWTGAELIVWGGDRGVTPITAGARYDPATDAWSPLGTSGEPTPRHSATAVWTGSGMIVWGGESTAESPQQLKTGGRYDPLLDAWQATSTAGAPTGRALHRAVWSGREMLVWGGSDETGGYTNSGGRYDPQSDAWAPIATRGAPDPRQQQAMVWSGTEMIVWGGYGFLCCHVQSSGGRYDPASDAWTPTTLTKAPTDRGKAAAVWSGDHFVIWGGVDSTGALPDDGGRHDPFEDTWTGTDTAPIGDRADFGSDWLCNALWIWGGQDSTGITSMPRGGGSYDPAADTWSASTASGAPFGRREPTVVAAGPRGLVWGGRGAFDETATGGVYCGCAAAPPPLAIARLQLARDPSGSAHLSWAAAAGASGYDLVRGDVGILRATGGDFSIATTGCLANDTTRTDGADPGVPAPGAAFWYLVRAVNASGPGTYDSADESQLAPRDAGIAASGAGCP